MKNVTIKIENKQELIGFLRSIGTETRFITVTTETEVDQNKTRLTGRLIPSTAKSQKGKLIHERQQNPYWGAIKVSRRNGFVNADFVKMVEKRYAEIMGVSVSDVEYTPGGTWYQHCHDENNRPLCLCEHQKDHSRKYLQMFPLRNLGETTYWLKGQKMTQEQVSDMYENWVTEKERTEWKPVTIVLAIDSIRCITFRKVNLLNETFSRIANTMARWKDTRVSTRPQVVAMEA